jgi:hypothetical protein
MRYSFLLLLVLTACRPAGPEPPPYCAPSTQATTLADAQRLVVGEWRLVGSGGGHPPFYSPKTDSGVRLEITLDSILVSDRSQRVGRFGWTLSQGTPGGIGFNGRWDGSRERAYLPYPEGALYVCESILRMGSCAWDGVCYSYERVR